MRRFTHEEAFAPVEGEQNIPIDMTMHDFRFTRRWFVNRNQKTWSTFFPRRFSHDAPVRMLQIGVFEGMDLVWCFQNILGHADSYAIAVDPWMETRKISQQEMNNVHERAYLNLEPWREKVIILRQSSGWLRPDDFQDFDLIIVDGDHTADAVYDDADFAFNKIKPGGWVVFDDVRNRIEKKDHVVHGLERYVDAHENLKFEWAHRHCDCWSKI